MGNYKCCIILIILNVLIRNSINTNLKVGVVEFQPASIDQIPKAKDRMIANIRTYVEILDNATSLDLIIYPESALNVHIPMNEYQDYTTIVQLQDNPCTDKNGIYPDFIKNISCAIKTKGQTYVVMNTVEKEKCKDKENDHNCKSFGFRYYNTDIIFNNEGTIIERYRKYNLFGEREINEPYTVDHTVFNLKNETIGVFTCFDILFKTPPEDLVTKGVKTIAYPTMWFSELPFLTALQTQQMWSIEHNVSIFSANANNPSNGGGGSGIFYGESGPVNYDIISNGGTKLLTNSIGDLPNNLQNITTEEIDVLGKQMDNFMLLSDHLQNYTSVLLNTTQQYGEYKVCHQENSEETLCCSFKVKLSTSSTQQTATKQYIYHLVAFAGKRTYSGVRDGGTETCSIIACTDSNVGQCGRRFTNYTEIVWPITFESIEIRANFTDNKNRTQYPNTLLSSIRPLYPTHFNWYQTKYNIGGCIIIERNLVLVQPQSRLLTFGIYGRNFQLDSTLHRVGINGTPILKTFNLYIYIASLITTLHIALM